MSDVVNQTNKDLEVSRDEKDSSRLPSLQEYCMEHEIGTNPSSPILVINPNPTEGTNPLDDVYEVFGSVVNAYGRDRWAVIISGGKQTRGIVDPQKELSLVQAFSIVYSGIRSNRDDIELLNATHIVAKDVRFTQSRNTPIRYIAELNSPLSTLSCCFSDTDPTNVYNLHPDQMPDDWEVKSYSALFMLYPYNSSNRDFVRALSYVEKGGIVVDDVHLPELVPMIHMGLFPFPADQNGKITLNMCENIAGRKVADVSPAHLEKLMKMDTELCTLLGIPKNFRGMDPTLLNQYEEIGVVYFPDFAKRDDFDLEDSLWLVENRSWGETIGKTLFLESEGRSTANELARQLIDAGIPVKDIVERVKFWQKIFAENLERHPDLQREYEEILYSPELNFFMKRWGIDRDKVSSSLLETLITKQDAILKILTDYESKHVNL
jgi:hypothetical protein